ncbi:MAG: succinylglutamate desuccinylase/aspartoacylase family protein [Acetobacteraceae bacterium]|nr:succinylglutamate desuccinylase/aspartoacylase family protein [Acetobacteraceae bacterium]
MNGASPVWTELDWDRNGKQIGPLNLPYSVTRSAYGVIAIPACVVKNGVGPTLLLIAGNHGDEYEGQIALARLIRALEPAAIQGRVIILPAINLPAALAGTRVSPLDDRNLNRAFPGDPAGTPTQQIAHFLDSVMFPIADQVCDLHSGGSSLHYQVFASTHQSTDQAVTERGLAALRVFGAPLSVFWQTGSDLSFASHAAMKHGTPYLGGEYGGSGAVSREGVALIGRGIRRLMAHMGITDKSTAPPDEPVRMVKVPSRDYFVYAPEPGLFEPATELGETVRAGQLCGEVHFVDNPARPPVPCHFKADGFVICKRHFGRVERGDCVAHLAIDA